MAKELIFKLSHKFCVFDDKKLNLFINIEKSGYV